MKLKDFYISQVPGHVNSSHRTKAIILNAALELISDEGMGALSLATLMRKTKLSKPRIAYHIETIDSLIEETYLWAIKMGQHLTVESLIEAKDLLDKIIGIYRSAASISTNYPKLTQFMIHMSVSHKNNQVLKMNQFLFKTGQERIQKILEAHGFDPSSAYNKSLIIHSLITGMIYRFTSLKEENKLSSLEDELKALLVSSLGNK